MNLLSRPLHPLILATGFSLFFSAIAILLTITATPLTVQALWASDLPNRMLLLAGLVFLAFPNIEATSILLHDDPRRWRGPFWLHAVTMGWFYATGAVLLLWGGSTAKELQIPIWLAAGAIFGVLMAWMSTRSRDKAAEKVNARRAFHDLTRPYLEMAWGRAFAYVWPAIAVIATLAILFVQPLRHENPMFLPFLMVLFASGIGCVYPPAKYHLSWLNPGLGVLCVVLGLSM